MWYDQGDPLHREGAAHNHVGVKATRSLGLDMLIAKL